MRTVPEPMAAALQSGAATLCTCWLLTCADGRRLGFTDHDRLLTIEGVACSAASGWMGGAAEGELGFSPGTASAAGALSSDALVEADVAAGLYDGAVVEAWRVDWSDPTVRLRLWKATIARLIRSGAGFTAELEGPLAALKKVAGRLYGRTCDAVLGDPRCGLNLAGLPTGATCDKRWSTCTGAFANGVNFQGFPDIPGDDFLTVFAGSDGAPNDGGLAPVMTHDARFDPYAERPDVVAAALAWRGTPYRHQQSLKGVGCDCLGLVRGVWRELHGAEPEQPPPYRPDWAETRREERLLAAARRSLVEIEPAQAAPGMVLMFRMSPQACVKHCAILTALAAPDPAHRAPDARMVHAYWGRAVVEGWIGPWWRRRLVAAFAFPPISSGD